MYLFTEQKNEILEDFRETTYISAALRLGCKSGSKIAYFISFFFSE